MNYGFSFVETERQKTALDPLIIFGRFSVHYVLSNPPRYRFYEPSSPKTMA